MLLNNFHIHGLIINPDKLLLNNIPAMAQRRSSRATRSMNRMKYRVGSGRPGRLQSPRSRSPPWQGFHCCGWCGLRPVAGAQSARGRTGRDHTMLDGTRMACRGGREAGTSGRTRILPEAARKGKCTHTSEISSRVSPARRRAHSFSPDGRAAAASMGTPELYSHGTI